MTLPSKPAVELAAVEALLARPLLELVHEAACVHRDHHDPGVVQCSRLLSIKTGACPEDCSYCSQSARFETSVVAEPLLAVEAVVAEARAAREGGADRFCMGAAWREVRDGADFDRVCEMVARVKQLGLETCVTLGMLDEPQARRLAAAGLDYYNHNLDTGRSHYASIVSSHSYDDRLSTLAAVRTAGIRVCCGGILGLGEDRRVLAELLQALASLDPQPESVPINNLVPIDGTPLAGTGSATWDTLVRTIAAARILMPRAVIRLSAGRRELGEAEQALAFLAGANSVFVGDELLTTPNPTADSDLRLFATLGLEMQGTAR